MVLFEYFLMSLLVGVFGAHALSFVGIAFDALHYKMAFIFLEIILFVLLTEVYFHDKAHHLKKRALTYIHYIVFGIYVLSLIDVLFLSADLHRSAYYMSDYTHMNVIPFKTVMLYYNGYLNGNVSFLSLFRNIAGNFVLFMPFAYFLPFFYLPFRKWYVFVPTMISLTFLVEVLQVNMMVGSGDIDDILLNVIGAFVFYMLIKYTIMPFIYRLLGRE